MPLIVFRLKGIHIITLKFYSQASFNNLLREAIWLGISLRDYKKPLSPHSPSFDQHVSKCYGNSIVEGTLLWNSTIQFSTWRGGGGVQLGHSLYSVLNFFCELDMGENICNQSKVSCFNCCQFASRKQHFIGLKKKKNSRCNFTN